MKIEFICFWIIAAVALAISLFSDDIFFDIAYFFALTVLAILYSRDAIIDEIRKLKQGE